MSTSINTCSAEPMEFPASYREVHIGKTLYCVTSVFSGEKNLGVTLEKLAVRHVLREMENRAAETIRACG